MNLPWLTSVARLFLDGRPTNISRLIVSVVVDPIKAVVSRRFQTNVTKERRKRFVPFVTDTDAASTISTEPIVIWILTAASHAAPRAVFRSRPTARVSVLPLSSNSHFNGQATAGFSVAVDQVRPRDDCFSAARATTFPKGVIDSAKLFNLVQDSQATECHAEHRVCGSCLFALDDVRAVVRAEPHAFVPALKCLAATVALAGELIHASVYHFAVLTPGPKVAA